MQPHLTDRIVTDAARWYARLHAMDCSKEDRAAFDAWKNEDERHALAYERACQLSAGIDQLVALDPRMQAMLQEALTPGAAELSQDESILQPKATSRTRRWAVPAAMAASMAFAFVSLHFVGDGTRAPEGVIIEAQAKPRAVKLQDGSTVQLDVDSRVRVRMTAERRQVTLESGRALFTVAHDRSRPFSVAAATSRTTALGTQFQVELADKNVLVTLTEGSVAVDNEGSTQVWQERLRPGDQLRIDVESAAREVVVVDPAALTSWTRGRLLFRGTRLADAIEQVNRYATKKVRLADASLADLPVAGNFIAGDSELVMDAFASALPLRVVDGGEKEIILVRRYDDAHP